MLTSPSSSLTWTVTPRGTFPGGYNAHLFKHKMTSSSIYIVLPNSSEAMEKGRTKLQENLKLKKRRIMFNKV